jgi:hypothetical protein
MGQPIDANGTQGSPDRRPGRPFSVSSSAPTWPRGEVEAPRFNSWAFLQSSVMQVAPRSDARRPGGWPHWRPPVQCYPRSSRMRREAHVRLCVQERLVCSAGVSPAGVTIGSPVAGRVGRRETDGPEAPRQPHPRDGRELSGRNDSEREVAPKVSSPGGRARNREGEGRTARRKPIDATGRSGGVVSDGTATRTHRATGEALLVPPRNRRKLGRPYNRRHREVGRRREGDGWVRSSAEAG